MKYSRARMPSLDDRTRERAARVSTHLFESTGVFSELACTLCEGSDFGDCGSQGFGVLEFWLSGVTYGTHGMWHPTD